MRHRDIPPVQDARGFAQALFGTEASMGNLRLIEGLRQEGVDPDPALLENFVADLLELLPPAESG